PAWRVRRRGDGGAPYEEAGAVQRVPDLRPATALGLEADVDAAAAEVGVGRAGRDLAVLSLSRQPDLEVVALGGAEADVAGAALDDAIRQLEPLQDRLRLAHHRLQLVVPLGRRRQLHQLDLVELVVAKDALHVLAIGAGLATVARREGGVAPRQRSLRQHLAAMQRAQRD